MRELDFRAISIQSALCATKKFFIRFIKDSSLANTGEALWHVHRHLFNSEYDRPNARNVLFLVTDQPSDDDVIAPARALRESGVTVKNIVCG